MPVVRVAVALVLILVVALASAMVWQHLRYLSARRDVVQDRQPLVYGASAFHVVTFLDVAEDTEVVDALRRLRAALAETAPDARLVYAGQAAFTRPSSQLGHREWDAVVLVQYPSRAAYDSAAAQPRYRDALGAFDDAYSHGMRRPWLQNLLMPQVLLGLRAAGVLRGGWNVPALVPAPASEVSDRIQELGARQADLLRLRDVNDAALVVFNLILAGDAAQRAADRSYAVKMLGRMAARAHGPMHLGSAVTLEGEARFDNVAIVYYPGVRYFAELIGSRFFQGIIGDKQLGDTQAVPTVPVLARL